MAVQVVNSAGVKVALAHHLASKASVGGKKHSPYIWPPSYPQAGTQTAIVLELLWDGKVLTREGVAKEYEIYCLPQIVRHLRAYHGWPIKTRRKLVVNAHGQPSKHGEYFLHKPK
jgi:hypothetical protein